MDGARSCRRGYPPRHRPIHLDQSGQSLFGRGGTATASQQVLAEHHRERPAVVRATSPDRLSVLPGSPGIILPARYAYGLRGRNDGRPSVRAEREDDADEARPAGADRIRIYAQRHVMPDWQLARGAWTNDRANNP